MFNGIQETVRLSSNIARAIGICCPLKTLYIDESITNATKVKAALSIIPNTSYIIDSASNLCSALWMCKKFNYDCLLVREGNVEMIEQAQVDPLIIVPHSYLNFSKWKLGYTLNDMILESLNQTSFKTISTNGLANAA